MGHRQSKGVVLKDTKAKGEEVRPVLLPPVAIAALKAEHRRQSALRLRDKSWNRQGVVFPGKDGSWRRPDTLSRHFA